MIKGIGTDIVDNMRFSDPDKFIKKILSEKEIERYNKISSIDSKRCYIGVRFAAKEALYKAGLIYTFNQISILNKENGAPFVEAPNIDGIIHISLSHEKQYSIAYVIYEDF